MYSTTSLFRLKADRDAALLAARAAVRDSTRLTRLLAILSEPGTTEAVLDKTLSTLSELFVADIIVLLDPVGTGTLKPMASIGVPEDMIPEFSEDNSDGFLNQLMHAAKPLQLADAGECAKLDSRFNELQVEVAAYLPVSGENAARGALMVARCRPEPFAESEIDLLATMSYRHRSRVG